MTNFYLFSEPSKLSVCRPHTGKNVTSCHDVKRRRNKNLEMAAKKVLLLTFKLRIT